MKNIVVYQHRRKDTGEVFYVGIGINDRPYQHHQRNPLWYNIVNKTDFEVEILHTNISWEEACEEEKRLIKLYGRRDKGLGTLVNMTDGGDGILGYKHTEETIQNLRKIMIENNPFRGKKHSYENIKKMSLMKVERYKSDGNPFYGKSHTDESKEKISKSRKGKTLGEKNPFYGKKHSIESIEKMSPLTKEDVLYIRKHFIKGVNQHNRGNLHELAKKFNVKISCIQGIISNRTWKHI